MNSGEIWVKIDARRLRPHRGLPSRTPSAAIPDVSHRCAHLLGGAGRGHPGPVRRRRRRAHLRRERGCSGRQGGRGPGSMIAGVDGVASDERRRPPEEPTVEVEVDLARAQAAGVKPGDVRRAAATLSRRHHGRATCSSSRRCSTSWCGEHPRSARARRTSQHLLVDTPERGHVRARRRGDVRVAPNPAGDPA